jgi:type IV secretion system protein VirD4
MTATTTRRPFGPSRAEPERGAKPPGKVRTAARRKRDNAARVVVPYSAILAASAGADLVTGQPLLLGLGLGIAGTHAAIRLQEHKNWHRKGGKGAIRARRKYQGEATRADLSRKLSLNAARRNAAIMRPSLGGHTRGLPPEEAGVLIGAARGHQVYGGFRDSYAAFGPPGSGKTTWMAAAGLMAPGAVLFTSTRADMADHTAATRARKGPVWFINPGGDGGYPSSLRWSPLTGCEDPRVALEAAGALMHAAPKDATGKDDYWDHQSKVMLHLLLHAAALTPGSDIFQVRDWAYNPEWQQKAVKVLYARGAPGWGDRLAGLVGMALSDERYASAITGGVTSALAWLDDPALADLARPAPGEGFDARECIREKGTVYLIGADTPHNPLSPYFACFASYMWSTAKRMAADPDEQASCKLRLDPPLMMVIDEPAITCPVPLDRWSAEAGGHGVVLVTGFQSLAQLPQKWGEHGGQVLMDNITVKMMFGGVTNPDLLRVASGWGGQADTWDHTTGPDGGKTKSARQEPAFPEERLRQLPLGQAYVVHRSTRAFIADIGDVQEHPLYERATGSDFPAPAPAEQLAIDPPHREAVPMPAARPGPVPALTGPARGGTDA